MARLAVLTDRLPQDPSWKGAYTWEIIRALAESQHEVAVFTTEDPEQIGFTHPRLTVARPAPNWNVERFPRWAQAVMGFRPEIIHTFGLEKAALWPSLSIWPYLDALCKVLPGDIRRVSTMFDSADFHTAPHWHLGSESWTVFTFAMELKARELFQGRVDVVPMDEVQLLEESVADGGFYFVPAPVSEWQHRSHGLAQLADVLLRYPERSAWINGGWGELSLSERRRGWSALSAVADRVRLIEAQSLAGFMARVRSSQALWLECLAKDSWRYLLASQIGLQLGRERIGAEIAPSSLGSTVNSLSRLYLS